MCQWFRVSSLVFYGDEYRVMLSVQERKRVLGLGQITTNVLLTISLGIILFWLQAAAAQSPSPSLAVKKLFIVHSYEKGHLCGQPQHDGALEGLARSGWIVGENLNVQTYYMDTKRSNNTPELIKRQALLAMAEIESFQPDVILTLDDNAFKTIALAPAMADKRFVFSGMNGQPEEYNQQLNFMSSRENPGGRITGVYEKLHVREAVRVLSVMHGLKEIMILADLSPTGKAIARQLDIELASPEQHSERDLPCRVSRRIIHSWEEFQEVIAEVNNHPEIGAIYLGTLLLRDTHGQIYAAEEIIDYYIAHSRKPAIGLNYAFIKQGLYGGATVDFFAMGRLAGEKIAKILTGSEPGALPIEDAPRIALVFNLERAETLGLEIPSDILMAADEVFRK